MTPAKVYTEMKDSGADWIGKIPATWDISKIGTLYTQRNERVSDRDYPPLSVTMKGILPQLATAAKTDDGDNRKLVRVGDFAINSRSDRRGSCGISPYDGSVSLINTILIPRKKMHPGYYDWLFHTTLFADEFYKWGHGIVDDLWTTRWQEMKRILVPVPPYETQSTIAAYLDTQCAKIDEIIAQAKASIEDYKQWKASIIYEAVTKGLDPNVEMKKSGIEWIGSIPYDWTIIRVKNLLAEINDRSETGSEEPLSMSQVLGIVPSSMIAVANPATSYVGAKIVRPNDLVFNKLKAHLGVFAVSNYDGLVSPDYAVYRANERANPKFLEYLFKTPNCIQEFKKYITGVGAGLSRLYTSDLFSIKVALPVIDVQKHIVEYLNGFCSQADALIDEKQSLIDDLESYKKSLIYEVVTGKRRITEPDQMAIAVLSPDILRYQKALLMLRILDLLGNEARGRIHLQKCMFAAECLLNIPFQTQYIRYDHGPNDLHLADYETVLCDSGWFNIQKGSHVTYQKSRHFAEGLKEYMNVFSDIDEKLKHIVAFLKPMKTTQAERVATLLAAWNDFIIDGISHPTDKEIINEVMSNWTPNKANPQYSTWQDTLTKMRKNRFIPSGFGIHTLKKEVLLQEE